MKKYTDELSDLANPDTVDPTVDPKDQTPQSNIFTPYLGERINEKLVDGLFDKSRIEGFSTGYRCIDKIVDGIKVGSLTVLVAGTGMGKSILAINILIHLNRDQGMPVVYIDLENGELEALERIIKMWHGETLPEDFFSNEKYKEDVLRMKDELKTFHYYSHDDYPNVSRDMILKTVRYHARQGAKVFLIDPLECIPAEDVYDKQREEGIIVRDLKNLAQEEKIAIILCHHFRKTQSGRDVYVGSIEEIETPKVRIPMLDDIRGTSEIGDASTGVWALVRLNGGERVQGQKDRALFRVLKNRFGDLGDTYLNFESYPLGFYELTTEETIELYSGKMEAKIKKSKDKREKRQVVAEESFLLDNG